MRPFIERLKKNNWAWSICIVVVILIALSITKELPDLWITIINFSQTIFVACSMAYFYHKGSAPVKRVVFPVGVFSLFYSGLYLARIILEGGGRLQGEWGRFGTIVSTYVWIPVWFYASFSYYKSSLALHKSAHEEAREVREIIAGDF